MRRKRKWEQEHWWDALAQYNLEVSRGIVHTPEYDAKMAAQQRRFNEEFKPGRVEWPDPSDWGY